MVPNATRVERCAPMVMATLALAMLGCTTTEDTGDTTEGSTTSTTDSTSTGVTVADTGTTSSATGSSEGSTTGSAPLPSPCELAEIAQGVVGRTDRRTCDRGGDCVDPESDVAVWVFDDNPQIGGSSSEAGTLDPMIAMLDATTSGADGRFAFALGAGTYYVCTPEGSDLVLCSERIILVGADPLHQALYETGNGSSWSTGSCG